MDQKQVELLRSKLISTREELLQLHQSSKDSADTVMLDQSMVGRLSRMDAMQAQQMAQETNRRRQVQLQKIEAALRRMDEGSYGYCLKCEENISTARLNFDPASTRCIACADD